MGEEHTRQKGKVIVGLPRMLRNTWAGACLAQHSMEATWREGTAGQKEEMEPSGRRTRALWTMGRLGLCQWVRWEAGTSEIYTLKQCSLKFIVYNDFPGAC
jgi:hypothetical protein